MSRKHARMRARLGRAGALDEGFRHRPIVNISRRRRNKTNRIRLRRLYEFMNEGGDPTLRCTPWFL